MKPLALATKIPPPALFVLFFGGMWLMDQHTVSVELYPNARLSVASVLLTIGLYFSYSSIYLFIKAKTTINPTRPQNSVVLVTDGLYRYSRNPMYLALFIDLLAWGVFLANIYSLIFAILFVPLMNILQIIPEEKAMELNFREHYTTYKTKVNRWL